MHMDERRKKKREKGKWRKTEERRKGKQVKCIEGEEMRKREK